MKAAVVVAAVMLLASAAEAFPFRKNRMPFAEMNPAVGERAPQISLSDINGDMVSLAGFKGKVVLVTFWASWCPPCTNEIPGFEKDYEEFESRGFTVIGIALDDVNPQLIRDLGITYPVARTSELVSGEYDVSVAPQSFLAGKDGRILKKVDHYYEERELRADVEEALAEGN